jgi:hypothetical protein
LPAVTLPHVASMSLSGWISRSAQSTPKAADCESPRQRQPPEEEKEDGGPSLLQSPYFSFPSAAAAAKGNSPHQLAESSDTWEANNAPAHAPLHTSVKGEGAETPAVRQAQQSISVEQAIRRAEEECRNAQPHGREHGSGCADGGGEAGGCDPARDPADRRADLFAKVLRDQNLLPTSAG